MNKINPNDPLFGTKARKIRQKITAKAVTNPVSQRPLRPVLVGSYNKDPFVALFNADDRVCVPSFE